MFHAIADAQGKPLAFLLTPGLKVIMWTRLAAVRQGPLAANRAANQADSL